MVRSGRICASLFGTTLFNTLQAQITFEQSDLPVPGDVVERYFDSIPGFGPGANGAA